MSLPQQREVLRTLCEKAPSVSTQLIAVVRAAITEAQANVGRKREILQAAYQQVQAIVGNKKEQLGDVFQKTGKFALFRVRHSAMGEDVKPRETMQGEYAATLREIGLGSGNAEQFAKELTDHDRCFLKADVLVADDILWLDPGELLAEPPDSVLAQKEQAPSDAPAISTASTSNFSQKRLVGERVKPLNEDE